MQLDTHFEDGKEYYCAIPRAHEEVMPGVHWGNVARLFTPAFWRLTCITNGAMEDYSRYRLGDTFKEEVVACLLGGHGITGELGNAAFHHLRQGGVFNQRGMPSEDQIEALLSEPLLVNGRMQKYRYPRQKAKYIAAALCMFDKYQFKTSTGEDLRNWLIGIPGIGLKTGSWITRNWLNADDVAILDIHIHRAGVIAGFYDPNDDVRRSYREMELKFLDFAKKIGVPANVLDNQIWTQLRTLPSIARKMLIERGVKSGDRCGLPTTNHSRTARNHTLFANT